MARIQKFFKQASGEDQLAVIPIYAIFDMLFKIIESKDVASFTAKIPLLIIRLSLELTSLIYSNCP